jgi:hypothetical protein
MLSEVNLEAGMPAADIAVRRLKAAICTEKARRTAAFKVIHGYGSSGVGGKIRTEARKYLDSCVHKGLIKCYIPGESFSVFDEKTRSLLSRLPDAGKDRDIDRYNNGITIVVL